MSKCEQCGRDSRGGTLCPACERETSRAAEEVRQVRCDCGREVMQIVARDNDGHNVKRPGPIPMCARCYMDAPRENPSYITSDGRDLYAGLATTDPNARYVCPGCGGTVVPRNCWGGKKTDYRCGDCGATGELPPVQLEPYPELTPDELIKKLSDPKRMMFGPPRAIRELRKKEGRNIYTGEPLGRGTDLDWLVGQKEEEEQNDEPPF